MFAAVSAAALAGERAGRLESFSLAEFQFGPVNRWRFAELISEYIWKPMGAEFDANITVDVSGFALAANMVVVVYSSWPKANGEVDNELWWDLDYLLEALVARFRS